MSKLTGKLKQWLQHKAVKVSAIILLALIGLFLVLMTIAQLYVNAHKDTIIASIKQQLLTHIKGEVVLKDVSINIWRNFPKVNVILNDISVSDTVYHKPLIAIGELSSSVSLTDLLTKKTNIRFIKVKNALVHLFVDSTGYSNHYLLQLKKKDSTATGTPGKKVTISEVTLENVTAISENAIKNKHFEINFAQLHASISDKDTVVHITMSEKAKMRGLGFNLAKGYYLENKEITAKWKLLFHKQTHELSFPKTKVDIDGQALDLAGSFVLGDSAHSSFKLEIEANKILYKKTVGLLTASIQKKLLHVDLQKPVDVKATIAGSMAYKAIPLVDVEWHTQNNEFAIPLATFSTCTMSGRFFNEKEKNKPRTDDNSEITLSDFSADWGGVLLKGKNISITNLIQPSLVFNLTSACKLKALDDKFNSQTMRFLDGDADIALDYNGPLIADASLVQNLSCSLAVRNGVVLYEPKDLTFSQCNGQLFFSSNVLSSSGLSCNVGKTKINVALSGKDIAKLADVDPGKAVIQCAIFSPQFDISDFKNLFANKKTQVQRKKDLRRMAKTALAFDEILDKGNLQLDLKANSVVYNRFTATALVASILFRHNDWEIKQVNIQHADGTFKLSGNITEQSSNYHKANVNINLVNVNVRKLFYAFDNFGQNGITYQNLQGQLNTNANISLGLDNKGAIIDNSINGNLFFSLKNGALINFAPVQKIQKFVFQDRDLTNITFAELKDSLIIRDNEINIKRMEIQSSVATLYVEGLYSPKGNTDISIQVPINNFLEKREERHLQNRGVHVKTGASIYLRAKSGLKGDVKIGLDLFKKFRKNKGERTLRDSL
ncbi:MAG: hypothetical protein J0I41_05485 [Filimonas sp.]|nr:hypothetical protein [Filimonas sp.]